MTAAAIGSVPPRDRRGWRRFGVRFRRLAHRIGFLFAFFALLLILIAFAVSYYVLRKELVASASSAMAVRTAEKAAAVELWMRRETRALEILARWPGFAGVDGAPDADRAAALRQEFRRWGMALEAPGFQSLMFLAPQTGVVQVALAAEDVGKVRRFRPYFREGQERTYLQPPFYSLSDNDVIMAAATPVTAADGTLLGVLAAEMRLTELDRIVGQPSGTLETAQSYLVNAARLFVTQPNGVADPVVLRRANFSPIVDACLAGGNGVRVGPDHRGVTVVGAYAWLDARDLCLISQADLTEVLDGMHRLTQLLILISGAALSIGGILAVFFARTLSAPIVEMAHAARRFGQGARDVRIVPRSSDELADLAESFNAMAADLAARDTRLRQSNRDLEQFAYVASHDLQEPLRKVTAFGDLLVDEKGPMLDDEGREYVRYMVEAARRMRTLINDLLAYARVTTRGLPEQPVALDTILKTVCEDLDLAIRDSGAHLSIAPLPSVWADRAQMLQLFQNLLSNSLKYRSADRPPRICITASQADHQVVISVSDNGIGFDPACTEEIFQPFRRLHGRGAYEGTGMGLAICRRIVERHGGALEAESEPGCGSVFRVRLAAAPVADPSSSAPPPPERPPCAPAAFVARALAMPPSSD